MLNIRKLKAQMVLHDITQEELANKIGLHLRTLASRMQNPETFRQKEMENLIQILDISDPNGIFFDRG